MAIDSKPTKAASLSKRLVLPSVALLCVAVLAILGVIGVHKILHDRTTPQPGKLTTQQLAQAAKDNAAAKEQALANPPVQSAQPPTPSNSSLSLSVQKGANNTETVMTSLGNVADGTCTLTVTNGAKHITQTADVLYQPQGSSCEGFSVPINDVGTGTWTIELDVTSNGVTATKRATETVQ